MAKGKGRSENIGKSGSEDIEILVNSFWKPIGESLSIFIVLSSENTTCVLNGFRCMVQYKIADLCHEF